MLASALEGFAGKVILQNQSIYNNQVFNELISMNNNNKMEQCLNKISALVGFLNYGADDKYRFDDMEIRAKCNNKL
jgi:hypothetical protein